MSNLQNNLAAGTTWLANALREVARAAWCEQLNRTMLPAINAEAAQIWQELLSAFADWDKLESLVPMTDEARAEWRAELMSEGAWDTMHSRYPMNGTPDELEQLITVAERAHLDAMSALFKGDRLVFLSRIVTLAAALSALLRCENQRR